MTEKASPQAMFPTPSGIDVARYYGPDTAPAGDLGSAGRYPFTRGIQETMYRGRLWTMRQYAGFGTAKQTNERFRWLLEQGQTGLSTAFDLPTQIGLDADDPKAKGEVGRVGVHIGTIDDMEQLFDQIPLDQVSTSLTINATASVLLAFYVAVARKRGIDLKSLKGTLQNDILKEFIARGTQVFPVVPSLRLCADSMEWSFKNTPQFHPISISGYHIREAGANAVQEVAYTFGNAQVYIQALRDRGVGLDEMGPKLAFFFGCHNHFLEEIAKFRAARKLWATIMRDAGATSPKSQSLRFHVQTCGSTLTSQQPLNNAMRVAWQAMAAVLGGAQSLHTNSYDEALALPSEESASLALRTQQILAHETGVTDTVDPVGGAWAIEALTREIENRVTAKLESINAQGGMLKLIETEAVQRDIQEAAYAWQQDVEHVRRKIVGVNVFRNADDRAIRRGSAASPKSFGEAAQVKRLKAFRKARDAKAATAALARLEKAARAPKENLFPHILHAVESRATIGEIFGTLRGVFGEYHGG